MLHSDVTIQGTNLTRLAQLYTLLREHRIEVDPHPQEVMASNPADTGDRLLAIRDLFAQKAKNIARRLPVDHPVKMPFGLLGELSIAQLHETTHTKMLAWLLDPNMPHGFGTVLLRALLSAAGADTSVVVDVQVHTEYVLSQGLGRVDIYATGRTTHPTQDFWGLWIEAKSKRTTREGAMQLERYARHRSHWRRKTAGQDYGIFLTPEGRHTSTTDGSGQWLELSYIRLAQILWREAQDYRGALGFEWFRLYLSGIIKAYAGVYSESLDTLSYHQLLDLETFL
ncbi:PD-(D/E)XK nuclease family protein [Acidithiobacillus caldus]